MQVQRELHFIFNIMFCSIVTAEEDEEIFIGEEQTDENLHQLKHREVFLSRQLEIINANTIRYLNTFKLLVWLWSSSFIQQNDSHAFDLDICIVYLCVSLYELHVFIH